MRALVVAALVLVSGAAVAQEAQPAPSSVIALSQMLQEAQTREAQAIIRAVEAERRAASEKKRADEAEKKLSAAKP